MAKLRTAALFVARLDAELAWRKQDIAAVTSALSKSNGRGRDALIRALLAITYAHWEGFNKAAFIAYGEHISLQGKDYGGLIRSLSGMRAIENVKLLSEIRRKVFASANILESLHGIESEKAVINISARFSKIGNLNYELFVEMMGFFGIDTAKYATKSVMIDESLLKRRNSIAHGDYLDVEYEDAISLSKEILEILGRIKDDLGDAAALKSYLRSLRTGVAENTSIAPR
jgi:hypothetical protein